MYIFLCMCLVTNISLVKVTISMINITWDAPPDGYTVDAPYAEATDSSTEGVPVRRPANAATSTWHRFGRCDSFREYKIWFHYRNSKGFESDNATLVVRTLGEGT